MNTPYIPGTGPPPDFPLGRFLPPIPRGMAAEWCRDNLHAGEWVLDPFGINPLVPIEIATNGYPVLVTVNNPIQAFMLKVLASAPQEEELTGALQDLATASKGDDRMEPYIRSLYHVNCGDCGQQIEADAFIWKKEDPHPYAALVDCPYCGARSEQNLTVRTLESIPTLPPVRLHFARALNRIADPGDPLRAQVENALNAYPARPLIVLQTIINKFESLEQTQRRRDLLIALILSAADQGNTLWAYPSPRNRPRQIVIPTVYQERNLWKVMEQAIQTWQVLETPIPCTDWEGPPKQPQGIYRFQGRIRELDTDLEKGFFSGILTAIPRPNQAFWTLSALWTGWIWGQTAVSPIRRVLSRQRYDWNWHTNALRSVFEALHANQNPRLKIWGLIPEHEPMLLLATLLSADIAEFNLVTYAQSIDDQLAQCQWDHDPQPMKITHPNPAMTVARDKVINYLRNKGEPASYQQIHAAATAGLAHENKLAIDIFLQNSNQTASETQKWIEALFLEGGILTRVAGKTASLESGEWWLADPVDVQPPLIDRVEEQIIRHLISTQRTTAIDVKKTLYQTFPGLYTPQDKMILNCLESYADLVDKEGHMWVLRESEKPAARKADIIDITDSLKNIAKRLTFRVMGSDPMLWFEENNPKPSYSFDVFSSAILSKHIEKSSVAAQVKILVTPGSRANLIAFKKQRDPLIMQILDRDYLIVKFRLVKDLEANPLLSRELFDEQIRSDPPQYRSSQLALF